MCQSMAGPFSWVCCGYAEDNDGTGSGPRPSTCSDKLIEKAALSRSPHQMLPSCDVALVFFTNEELATL
jgi:hypothetical protein